MPSNNLDVLSIQVLAKFNGLQLVNFKDAYDIARQIRRWQKLDKLGRHVVAIRNATVIFFNQLLCFTTRIGFVQNLSLVFSPLSVR